MVAKFGGQMLKELTEKN